MSNLTIEWIKCQNNIWCNFDNLNLEHERFSDLKGAYIIWSNNVVVRLGSGIN